WREEDGPAPQPETIEVAGHTAILSRGMDGWSMVAVTRPGGQSWMVGSKGPRGELLRIPARPPPRRRRGRPAPRRRRAPGPAPGPIVGASPRFMAWLGAARDCCPPEGAIGAGALRNLVWDHLTGRHNPPADVDVVFFGGADEKDVERCLRSRLPDVPWQAKDQ